MERYELISKEEYDKVDYPYNSIHYKVVDVVMLGGGYNSPLLHGWLNGLGYVKLTWTTCDEESQIVAVSSKGYKGSMGCYWNNGIFDVGNYAHYDNVLCIKDDMARFRELVEKLMVERRLYVRKIK